MCVATHVQNGCYAIPGGLVSRRSYRAPTGYKYCLIIQSLSHFAPHFIELLNQDNERRERFDAAAVEADPNARFAMRVFTKIDEWKKARRAKSPEQ